MVICLERGGDGLQMYSQSVIPKLLSCLIKIQGPIYKMSHDNLSII